MGVAALPRPPGAGRLRPAVLFAGFITNLGKKNRIDPLTGLFSKFELESDVAGVLDPAQPHKLTFMMFDIDDLKRINSLHDRIFGDEVIRITAHHLRSLLPPNASLYRLDGDEFRNPAARRQPRPPSSCSG